MSRVHPEGEALADKPVRRRLSNFEVNCNQVFVLGPNLTKELFQKVHAEVSAQESILCGLKFNTKHVWVSFGLLFLFLFSVGGSVMMWFTDSFDKAILSNLVLKNNSDAYDRFTKPMINSLVKVHIFNYTNLDRYIDGLDSKLKVYDVGPYVYEETLTRVNTVFHENGTLSFQEKRSYKFRPDMSKGRKQLDKIIVPNFNLLALGAIAKNELNFIVRMTLTALLKQINIEPFLELPAHKFIFGYEDTIYSLARPFLTFQGHDLTEKFGLLAPKNGTSSDVITVNTGLYDINKLGMIERQNHLDSLTHWATDECNSIGGTDGTVFSPYAVRQKKPVHTYYKDFCRKLTMEFEKEAMIYNETLKAYRYVIPENIFSYTDAIPENQCFCNPETGECPPQGFFNTTPCAFGAPAFLSFPHFFNGDPEIAKQIDGLRPNKKLHQTYVNINPKLGFAMSGHSRAQINVQVKKSFGFDLLKVFQDDAMLPLAWFDIGVGEDEMPKEVYDFMYDVVLLIDCLELALKYGFLLTNVVTFICLIMVFKATFRKDFFTSLVRRDSGNRRLIV